MWWFRHFRKIKFPKLRTWDDQQTRRVSVEWLCRHAWETEAASLFEQARHQQMSRWFKPASAVLSPHSAYDRESPTCNLFFRSKVKNSKKFKSTAPHGCRAPGPLGGGGEYTCEQGKCWTTLCRASKQIYASPPRSPTDRLTSPLESAYSKKSGC